MGRFLNADAYASTGQSILGNNMFTYCNNSPVVFYDNAGTRAECVGIDFGAPAGFATPGALSYNTRSGNNSGSIMRKIHQFFTNTDEQAVLSSAYFSFYKGIPVMRTNGNRSGYFIFIFLTRETNNRPYPEDILRHEYGHSVQMQKLGILEYTTNIFIPSWLEWGSNPDYYSREVEVAADVLGGVVSRIHSSEYICAGFNYLDRSDRFGIVAWTTIK